MKSFSEANIPPRVLRWKGALVYQQVGTTRLAGSTRKPEIDIV